MTDTLKIKTSADSAVANASLALHDWQMVHLMASLKQADTGEFASTKQAKKAFARWNM